MKQIGWEFYRSVFQDDDDAHEVPDEDDEGDDDDPYDAPAYRRRKVRTGRFLMTSFGMIPLTEDMMSNKNFRLWVGHTNFTITDQVAKDIAEVDGVEALKFFSRYRFLVCVGKMFNSGQVKIDIQNLICDDDLQVLSESASVELDKRTSTKVQRLRAEIEQHEHWLIYVLPNGRISSIASDDYSKTFEEQATLMTLAFKLVGGAIFGP